MALAEVFKISFTKTSPCLGDIVIGSFRDLRFLALSVVKVFLQEMSCE